MRYYSDLLPSYLDGENIRKHSGVIERSDRYLDGLVELFGLWDKLERPILIKREQTGRTGVNNVTLYVNTPTPIKEIIIEGDIEETITPEDTVTTSYTNTWTIQNPSIEIYSHQLNPSVLYSIRMPFVTVTVRTETHTYTKTYPENDTIENNNADHDIFLDITGGILGIPRRQYSTVNIPYNLIGNLKATVPPYMAKEVETISNGFTILPCNEDDYYYKERLDYFINTTDTLRLFRTVYDKDVAILRKEDEVIPSELVGTESTVLFTHINKGSDFTVNRLNIDTTNVQQVAEQSFPITRPVQIYPYVTLTPYWRDVEEYVNYLKVHLTIGLAAKTIDQQKPSREVPIANLPVNITYEDGTEIGTFTTDETGTAHISIDGARSGQQRIKWDLTREYPYFELTPVTEDQIISYNASLFKLSLSDGAWQYKEFSGTTVTDLETPTILDNDDLDCGTGILTYTPAINPALVDLTEYTIEVTFHYTGIGQSILLGTLQETETNAMINGIRTQPREHTHTNPDPTDTHTITYKFLDNTCYTYYDDTYTGQHQNLTDTTSLIYLAGYNYYTDSENTGTQITEITATPTVDINTPPEYTGDEIIDLQTTTTKIIPRTDKPTARDPTRTVDGYDLGNWHVPVFKDITVDSNTRNMTITVILDTTLTTGWRIGFAKDNNTSAGWDSTYFLSTNATYTAGEHEITFVCDNTGTWNVLFDGAPSRKQPFTLSTEKNFAAYVSYDTGSIMVRSIRTSTTGASGTGITAETLNSTTGSASIKATLTTSGSGLEGATIQCKNGSTLLTSGTTDSNGECTFDLSSLQAGSYTLTIQYMGDSTYSASSTTHSITITDPTPVTLNLYGKGQSTGWSTTQWTTIEINAAAEAHCNYTKRNAILKQLPLSGDFTLVLHIQASHNTSWNWGLIPSQSDYSNPAMKVSKGDTLNGSTSIATMFDHGSGVWDTTVPVTITRSGTTYTLEYNGNSYSFTGSTDTLYFWMDKTGSGNLFLTYIETTATMQ